jgi:hypothetical protein
VPLGNTRGSTVAKRRPLAVKTSFFVPPGQKTPVARLGRLFCDDNGGTVRASSQHWHLKALSGSQPGGAFLLPRGALYNGFAGSTPPQMSSDLEHFECVIEVNSGVHLT